jgi:hypothetical protein
MSRRAGTALAAAFAFGVAATAARAQEASRDRADLDLAAGRAVPAQAASVAERPPRERVAEAAPGAPAATRRPVRVVLPSPYGR